MLRSRATQAMNDAVTAQKRPGPSGSPIFKTLRRCFLAMCHQHKAFVAPCTDFKPKTPNSQHYFLTAPLIFILRFYRTAISPMFGKHCRFYPSCSNFMIQAVGSFGVRKGLMIGILRLAKCHPFNSGGYDPVENWIDRAHKSPMKKLHNKDSNER